MTRLSCKQVSFQIDGASILKHVSCDFESGELVALVGPNGSGKTTLLRVLAGLLDPQSGNIRFNDTVLSELSARQRAQYIGYLPQHRDVAWNMSVTDLVSLGRFAWGGRPYDRLMAEDRLAVDQALQVMELDRFRDRGIHTLSGGERARVHISRLLAGQAPVILADEPANALDLKHQYQVMHRLRTLADEGRCIVTAIHDLDAARRWADRTILMQSGQIVDDGDPDEILCPENLASVFSMQNSANGLVPTS